MRLDGIVTVVDAKHLVQHLDDQQKPEGAENEAVEQVLEVIRKQINNINYLLESFV